MRILQHKWEKINDCFKGPDGFHFRIDYSDESSFSESTNDNLYMKLFIRNFTLRPSCHSCRFKKVDRDSDITIGDCWNAGESIPEFKSKGSISLVIVYSTKGKENLSAIKDKLLIYKGNLDLLLPSYEKKRK